MWRSFPIFSLTTKIEKRRKKRRKKSINNFIFFLLILLIKDQEMSGFVDKKIPTLVNIVDVTFLYCRL